MFPQFGGVGGSTGIERAPYVTFKAGKMSAVEKSNGKFLVTPETTKGQISLVRGDDQLLHFQWKDRTTGTMGNDFIIFPGDAAFLKVDTGCEGDRVYILQYKSSARRFFFWMQAKNDSDDHELAKKLNDTMNNPQPAAPAGSAIQGGNLDQNALMQMLSSMGAGGNVPSNTGAVPAGGNDPTVQVTDLQSILQSMGFPATSSSSNGPNGTTTSEAATSSPAPSTAVSQPTSLGPSTSENDESEELTEEELLQRALEESMKDYEDTGDTTDASVAASASASASSPPPSSSSQGNVTSKDLQRALQMLSKPRRSISLKKILSPENIFPLIQDSEIQQLLIPFLPCELQTPEELITFIRTPQIKQAISSLSYALQTSNLNDIMATFELDPSSGAAKMAMGDGDGAFLDSIQDWANKQKNQK